MEVGMSPISSRKSVPQRARHELLAGAGFTVDAGARFACRDTLNLHHYAAHGFAGEDWGVLAQMRTEIAILGFEARKPSSETP